MKIMMINPETYKEGLKGKSQQQILQEIEVLNKEIEQLKKDRRMGKPDLGKPSRTTILSCDREYLKMAI